MGDNGGSPSAAAAPAPKQISSKGLKRRNAVSAEPTVEDPNFKPVVHPKDAATSARLRQVLAKCALFSALEEDQLRVLIDAMFESRGKPGELVIKQGATGDNFYVIEEGTLDIFVRRGKKTEGLGDKVLTVKPGQFFGELALMYNCPRAATVQAVTDVVLWAIDRVHFRQLLMGTTLKKRKQYEDALEKIPILQSLEKYERLTIADAVFPVTFKQDDVVIKEGDKGDCFFIILEGEVTCLQQDKTVGHLKVNDYFGEIALLTDKPRVATIKVTTPVLKAIKLDRERFTRLLGPVESILRRNMDNYRNYMGKKLDL